MNLLYFFTKKTFEKNYKKINKKINIRKVRIYILNEERQIKKICQPKNE